MERINTNDHESDMEKIDALIEKINEIIDWINSQ